MRKKKWDYLPADVEITLFDSADIVTTSSPDAWLDSDGNVDTGGWT